MPLNPPGVPPRSDGVPPLSANLPYQQSGGDTPPPAQAAPLPLGQALAQLPRQYFRVLTRLAAATFREEMGKASWGSVWIQLRGFALFSGLMAALLVLELLYLAVSGTKLSPSALYITEISVILITFVLVVASFFIQVGVFYLLARRAGGQGTFLAQSYSTLLFLVPGGMIVEVLTVLTAFSAFSWLFLSAWLIYNTVLGILMIKAVHDLSGGKASAVVLILPMIGFAVAGVGVLISSLVGAAHTEIYKRIGEIIGVLFSALLVVMLILSLRRKGGGSPQPGRRIVATVTRVHWLGPMVMGPEGPHGFYVVTAVGTDPQMQRAYTFRQVFDRPPRCAQGDPVTIVLDASNVGYYMEL